MEESTENSLQEPVDQASPATDGQSPEPIAATEPATNLTTIDQGDSSGGVEAVVNAELNAIIEALKLQIQGLEREKETWQVERDELTAQRLRLAADFENFRKRTQTEKEELETRVKCNTIIELLPVVDNFDRARSQIKPQTDEGNNIHKSYQGVYKQLVDCLKRIGVSPMRAEGKEFDPNQHEALLMQPTDQHPEGTVIEEFERGYLLGDRVLRYAKVKVAAPPEEAATAADEESTEPSEALE